MTRAPEGTRSGTARDDEVSAPVPTELLKARIDKLASLGLFCEFTGGETLLHPDLIDLVRYASSYRFDERWIITNGYLLSAEIVKQLDDAGLTHLQISIDGVTPNATTVKVLKPLKKKLEHLRDAKSRCRSTRCSARATTRRSST